MSVQLQGQGGKTLWEKKEDLAVSSRSLCFAETGRTIRSGFIFPHRYPIGETRFTAIGEAGGKSGFQRNPKCSAD